MEKKNGMVLLIPCPDGGVKKFDMKPFKINNNNNVNPTCPTSPPQKSTYTPYPPQEKIPMG